MPTRSPLGREVRTLLMRSLSSGGRGSVCSSARARNRRARASPPFGSRPMTSTVSSPAMVPSTSGELGLVDGAGEELGGTGRGAQHDQVGARLGADEQLGAEAGQPVRGGGGLPRRRGSSVAALAGDGVHEGAGGRAHLDGVELDEVARQRRLRDVHAGRGEQLGELGLGAHLVGADEVDDLLVPGALGRGPQGGLRSSRCSRSQVMIAFWACRRFSASSQTTLCGPSSTSASISLPR